jgi:formate dehydrogenase maturation protein FdhE
VLNCSCCEKITRILSALADAEGTLTGSTWLLSLRAPKTAAYRQTLIDRGKILFAPAQAAVNEAAAEAYAAGLIQKLSESMPEYKSELLMLAGGLSGRQAAAVLTELLSSGENRDGHKAGAFSVSPELLSFFVLHFARPFRREAAYCLTADLDLSRWNMGRCPVCGHAPGMGIIDDQSGSKKLWCCACETLWNFKQGFCPFCFNEDNRMLGYFTMDDDVCRVNVCDACGSYLKTIRADGWHETVQVEKEYLLSAPLDAAAHLRGYGPPSSLSILCRRCAAILEPQRAEGCI